MTMELSRSKNERFLNMLGWSGGALSLTAYGMVTNGILGANSFVFLSMNVVACVFLILYTVRKKAFANTAINSVYLLITIIAIGRGLWN
jgi:hypothetical protein